MFSFFRKSRFQTEETWNEAKFEYEEAILRCYKWRGVTLADSVAKAGEVGQGGVAGQAFGDRLRPGVLPSPSGCAENDGRLRSADDLCEPPQVLCNRC